MNDETNCDTLLINCDKLCDQEHIYKQWQNYVQIWIYTQTALNPALRIL